jgi:uncharacterized membrane protein YecN with MAPEG domain
MRKDMGTGVAVTSFYAALLALVYEYAVFALLLMAFAELQGAPGWAVHLLGLALLAGRLCHALGIGREPESGRLRVLGMQLTFTAIGAAALANLGLALASWMPV